MPLIRRDHEAVTREGLLWRAEAGGRGLPPSPPGSEGGELDAVQTSFFWYRINRAPRLHNSPSACRPAPRERSCGWERAQRCLLSFFSFFFFFFGKLRAACLNVAIKISNVMLGDAAIRCQLFFFFSLCVAQSSSVCCMFKLIIRALWRADGNVQPPHPQFASYVVAKCIISAFTENRPILDLRYLYTVNTFVIFVRVTVCW